MKTNSNSHQIKSARNSERLVHFQQILEHPNILSLYSPYTRIIFNKNKNHSELPGGLILTVFKNLRNLKKNHSVIDS